MGRTRVLGVREDAEWRPLHHKGRHVLSVLPAPAEKWGTRQALLQLTPFHTSLVSHEVGREEATPGRWPGGDDWWDDAGRQLAQLSPIMLPLQVGTLRKTGNLGGLPGGGADCRIGRLGIGGLQS